MNSTNQDMPQIKRYYYNQEKSVPNGNQSANKYYSYNLNNQKIPRQINENSQTISQLQLQLQSLQKQKRSSISSVFANNQIDQENEYKSNKIQDNNQSKQYYYEPQFFDQQNVQQQKEYQKKMSGQQKLVRQSSKNNTQFYDYLSDNQFCLSQVLHLTQACIPNYLNFIGISFLSIGTILFIQYYYQDQPLILPGYGLGLVLVSILFQSVITSLHFGLGILQSMSIDNKEYSKVGNLFFQGLLIFFLYILCIIPVLYYLEEILLFVGVQQEIAFIARTTVDISIPGQICFAIWNGLKQILRSKNRIWLPTIVQNSVYLFTPVICYVFQYYLQSYQGILYSRNILDFLVCVSFGLLFKYNKKLNPFFQDQHMKDIFDLKIFELALQQDIQQISVQVTFLSMYLVFQGASLALNQKIHSHLEKLLLNDQKLISRLYISRALGTIAVYSVILWFCGNIFKKQIVETFTTNLQMQVYFQQLFSFYINLILFPDLFTQVMGSILKCAGYYKFVSSVFIITYYCIALPFSYITAVQMKWGLFGAYITWFIFSCLTAIIFYIKIKTLDYKKCVEKIKLQHREEVDENEQSYEKQVDEDTENINQNKK